MGNKKPTMMQVKNAISNLINEFSAMSQYLTHLDQTLGSYIEYKKDTKKFPKWLDKQVEKQKEKENTDK